MVGAQDAALFICDAHLREGAAAEGTLTRKKNLKRAPHLVSAIASANSRRRNGACVK
jgi:hypothetical protein